MKEEEEDGEEDAGRGDGELCSGLAVLPSIRLIIKPLIAGRRCP